MRSIPSSDFTLGFLSMTKKNPAYEKIAPLVGQVTIDWNHVQFWIFCIFWELLEVGFVTADALFFSMKSDRGQRDATSRLIKVSTISGDLKTTLGDLIERTNKLSGRRNDIIHAMIFVWKPSEAPVIFGSSSPRLSKKADVEVELAELIQEIGTLSLDLARSVGILHQMKLKTAPPTNALMSPSLGLLATPLPKHNEPTALLTPKASGRNRKG